MKNNIKYLREFKTPSIDDIGGTILGVGCLIFVAGLVIASALVVLAMIKWAFNYLF